MQLIVSAGLILAMVLWGVIAPASLGGVFDTALAGITRNFGWLYLWVVLGLVVMSLVLAVSRYGDLKLGGSGSLPPSALAGLLTPLRPGGRDISCVSRPAGTLPSSPRPWR